MNSILLWQFSMIHNPNTASCSAVRVNNSMISLNGLTTTSPGYFLRFAHYDHSKLYQCFRAAKLWLITARLDFQLGLINGAWKGHGAILRAWDSLSNGEGGRVGGREREIKMLLEMHNFQL